MVNVANIVTVGPCAAGNNCLDFVHYFTSGFCFNCFNLVIYSLNCWHCHLPL